MSLILAVEPDKHQGETVRRLVDQQAGAKLVLVTSAYAAVVMINRQVPDLILLGASLGSKATDDIVDRFHLASSAPNPQTLHIPPFRSADVQTPRAPGLFRRTGTPEPAATDPEAFGTAIAICLARVEEQRHEDHAVARLEDIAVDSVVVPSEAGMLEDGGAAVPSEEPEAPSDDEEDEETIIDLDSVARDDALIDAEVHFAQLAVVQAQAEARLASELERVRREAEQLRASELARLQADADAQRRAEVHDARAAAEADTRNALAAELASVRRDAEQALAEDLARVRAEAEHALAQRLQEAETLRAAAVEQARTSAEQAAAQALEAEVARIRAETEERLATELRRVQEEAEQARRAQERTLRDVEAMRDAAAHARVEVEQTAARTLEAEMARVRRESDARLEAELAQARQEAEDARRAQQRAQADADAAREAAAREAREAAEAEAAATLEAEVQRLRTQVNARLQRELDAVRAEAEEARLALQNAQIEAEAARDLAAREARIDAEAAAARAHEGELARVRSDAQLRLREELERVRRESESEIEARARAEATLQAEIARARTDADARLASEVADVRAEAERRRDAELAEMREQLAHAYECARDDARSVATRTISAEVSRAEIAVARTAARVAARASGRAASATVRAAGIALRWLGKRGRAALPVVIEGARRLPPRRLVAAAMLLLAAGGAAVVDVSSLTRTITSAARDASGRSALLMGVAAHAVQARFESATRPHAAATPAAGGTATPVTPAPVPTQNAAGLLSVFSRVPLDLYVSGRRIGRTGDDNVIVLAPGRYSVELVSTDFNYRGEVVLHVRSGETTSHTVSLPNGLLQVRTEPGAEVWVEGTRVGVSPLGPVPVPIGTRDVVVRHPDRGERREAVEVQYNSITELSVEFPDPPDPSRDLFPLPPLARVGP